MMKFHRYGFLLPLLLLVLAFPEGASAQTGSTKKHDSIWNGILIGAAVGAVVGMALAPPAFCSPNDPECTAIVRTVIGLPSIGVGIGVGALVDGLHHGRPAAPAPFRSANSVNLSFRF